MKKIIASALLILFSFTIFGIYASKKITLKQNVTGHLKRAADASTIHLAKQELLSAVDYLEENNLTQGYTSVLWKTPDEDITFWFQNLKASLYELEHLKSESALERTNVLIKLRETLVDQGESTRVTVPKGLHVFPNNKRWTILMSLAILSFLVGFVLIPSQIIDSIIKKNKA